MEQLSCLKCGYALQGLPARKCDDCGHVYLRCPECGASQIANEAQNLLLLQMRARAAKLPGRIQTAQISLLVALGVGWIVTGFIAGASTRNGDLWDDTWAHGLLALPAGLFAALVRLLTLRTRRWWVGAGGSAALIAGAFALGLLLSTAGGYARPPGFWMQGALVLVGAAVGAAGATLVGWVLLWLFANDTDLVLLVDTHRTAARGRLLGDANKDSDQAQDLAYCTHCAAAMPPLAPRQCDECGLRQVTCPTCRKHCGVSDALAGMVQLGHITRAAAAGMRVGARTIVLPLLAMAMFGLAVECLEGSSLSRARPPLWGLIWIPADTMSLTWLGFVVALLTWFVFARGALASAVLNALLTLAAGAIALVQGHTSLRAIYAVIVLAVGAAGVSLAASLLATIFRAGLPGRRIEALEEVVPELARAQDAAGR